MYFLGACCLLAGFMALCESPPLSPVPKSSRLCPKPDNALAMLAKMFCFISAEAAPPAQKALSHFADAFAFVPQSSGPGT